MKKQLLFFLLGVFMSLGAFAQNLIVNGGFDLPDDGVKYQFINQIPGWLSDDPTINHNGRQNPVSGLDGSKYCEYMTNISGAIYQPIDAITGDSVLYKFSFKTSLDWLPNAGDLVYNVMYFYDWKKGTNISTRKLLDSIAIQMTTSGNGAPVQNVSGQFKLKLDSAVKYKGDSLVIGFRIYCAGNTNTWGKLDGIVLKKYAVFQQMAIANGGFDLPDDGVKYQFINQIPGWLSDDPTINHNGRQSPVSGLDGSKYCEYMTNISGAIYQPLDAITGDSVLYKFSFKTSLDWLPNAGDLVYNVVYFYDWKKGTNISTRKLLDSIAIQMTTSGNGAPVQDVSGQFKLKLDSAVKYNGDSLVIGFRIHCAGNTNTWGKLDGITIKKQATFHTVPFANGGFDLPDDGVKYQFINQIPGWLSDDPTINHNGRQSPVSGLDGSKYCEYMTNISGAIYQPLAPITGDSVLYKFSFKTSLDWLPNAGDLVYNVMYFYDWKKGTNISTRKLLDSIAIQMTTSGNGAPVQNVSGQFKLKLDSAVKYNGDSLVIGFRIHCAGNTNTWGKLDGITIKRDGTLYFPAITKPPKPTGLAVNTYRTLKNVILSWAAASATPQAYLVFKNNVRIDSIAGTRLNDTILNLANGTYIFGLVARDASGSKSDTAKISYTASNDVTPPTKPSGLTAPLIGLKANLSWTASTDNSGSVRYIIYLNGASYDTVATTSYMTRNLPVGIDKLGVAALDYSNNKSDSVAVSDTIVALIDLTNKILNPSFTYPSPYVGKIVVADVARAGVTLNLDTIPGWHFESPVERGDHGDEGRDSKGSPHAADSLHAYLYNQNGPMYTVLNYTYPTVDTGTIYKLNYLELNEYIASGIPSVRVRLGAKSHTTGAITYIDSASIATKGTSNDGIWRPYKATFLLQHPTAVLGDSIVLELKCVNSANVWIGIDDIAFSAEPFKLVPVTSVAISFANANDSLEVLKSAACTAVFTPSDASNQKVTWAVSDTTLATISSSGALTAKSVKTGIVKVRLTSQADPTKKDSISVLIYKTVATSLAMAGPDTVEIGSFNGFTVSFVPANTTYQSVKWSVTDTVATINPSGGLTTKDILGYERTITVTARQDSLPGLSVSKQVIIAKKNAFVPVTINNPDFELPNTRKIQGFNNDSIPGWHSEDQALDDQGVESGSVLDPTGLWQAYQNTHSHTSIYQPVAVITNKATTYVMTFLNKRHGESADTSITNLTNSFLCVISFSHYAPGQPMSTRLRIDSTVVDMSQIIHPTQLKATLNIPANVNYVGDSLIIEIAHRNRNYGDANTPGDNQQRHWANFDDVALALSAPVVHPASLSLTFENLNNTLGIGKHGLVTASFVPANPTYTAVTWSVSDASIATIDAQGNLTGVKKGTVTVTGTAKYDATVKGTLSITINATGINSIVADEIYVYPNPSDGSFTLEAKPASDVTILDVTGKVIYEAKTSADKTNLSISGKGIYLLQVKNNGIVTTKKLVVQ